jgi:hypothetical protein
LIFRTPEKHTRVYSYEVEALDQEVLTRGNSHLAIGRLQVRSLLTWHQAEASFVVLHLGGLDFIIILRQDFAKKPYETFKKELLKKYESESLVDLVHWIRQEFPGVVHQLDDLFLEEKRRIIGIILKERFAQYRTAFEQLAEQDAGILNTLGRLSFPIPRSMRVAASTLLDHFLEEEIQNLGGGDNLQQIKVLLEAGRAWNYQPENRPLLATHLADQLHKLIRSINSDSDLSKLTKCVDRLLDVADLLGTNLDLWQTQNDLLDAYSKITSAGALTPPVKQLLVHLAERLKIHPQLLGWQP